MNHPTAAEIVAELSSLGSESYKRVLMKHGAREPFFGVKIEDLKKIQKRIKTNHELALALYDTGISDAMYLAGLIVDDRRMTKQDLHRWLQGASWSMIAEYTVPWVAAGSKHGRDLALEWIDARDEGVATAGWFTLSNLVGTRPDQELDLAELKKLLARVGKSIHSQPNRVRYAMNGFVIATGCSVLPLHEVAIQTAKKIGPVEVDMVGACQVPFAPDYIEKVKARGAIGKKRKSAKC
ncbi:MAG: DNA alkylation repair protein [Pirellulaceae bacterium]